MEEDVRKRRLEILAKHQAEYFERELAARELLKALAAREYADSIVQQKTVEIERLEKFLDL